MGGACLFAHDHQTLHRTREALLVPHLQAAVDPYLYFTVRVTADLLDLTNEDTRDELGVTLGELVVPTEEWDADMARDIWAATHHIGRLAVEDGRFDGILYPPYPATELLDLEGKQNVAIFMDPNAPKAAVFKLRARATDFQIREVIPDLLRQLT